MKESLKVIGFVFVFVLVGSFLIFNMQYKSINGFAVFNDSTNETIEVSEEMALQAINESEIIIENLLEDNFSVGYMEDLLIDAKIVFQKARYAAILRGDIKASENETREATMALKTFDERKINYSAVLVDTDKIKERGDKILVLVDQIILEEIKISNAKFVSEETIGILQKAKVSFSEGRYDECEEILNEFEDAFEKEQAETSRLSGLRKSAMNFFQKNWMYILIFLAVVGITSYLIYKKHKKKILIKKIRKMAAQKKVLIDLTKKAQIERFEKNTLSESVYKIKIKEYQGKMQKIKEELPVLEAKLKELENKNKKL